MTTIDEKEILVIEKLKAEVAKLPLEVQKIKNDMLLDNKKYLVDAWKLAFYGVAVGAGGVFAVAKTLQLLQCSSRKKNNRLLHCYDCTN